MRYTIMRMSKLKGLGSTARSLQHNFREIETPNANESLIKDNIHSATGVDEVMGRLRERLRSLERKPRKDAVTCVEYLMTASPEWFLSATVEQKEEFFKGSQEWLENKYGKENVISFSIHVDETTPHISAHVVPITKDGRLSAKELIGAKKQMQEDQTTFAAKHEHIGLERGIKGSKAVHQDIKSYYASVNKAKEEERNIKERFYAAIPDKKIFEGNEQYKQRVGQRLNEEFKGLQQKASHASNKALTEERAKNLMQSTQEENNRLKNRNKELRSKSDERREIIEDLIEAVGGFDKAQNILGKLYEQREAEEKARELEKQRKAEERKRQYRSQSRGRSI